MEDEEMGCFLFFFTDEFIKYGVLLYSTGAFLGVLIVADFPYVHGAPLCDFLFM